MGLATRPRRPTNPMNIARIGMLATVGALFVAAFAQTASAQTAEVAIPTLPNCNTVASEYVCSAVNETCDGAVNEDICDFVANPPPPSDWLSFNSAAASMTISGICNEVLSYYVCSAVYETCDGVFAERICKTVADKPVPVPPEVFGVFNL